MLSKIGKDIKKHKAIYIMAIPMLLYYLIFCYLPMGGIVMAFQDFKASKGFFRSEFVGLKHFIVFFKDIYFWRLVRNTFMINVYDVIVGFPIPIIIALLLNEMKGKYLKTGLQTMMYIPNFISTVVLCGMILDFCDREGLFNDILVVFGAQRSNLMLNKSLFKPIFVLSNVWSGAGWGSIVYLAGIAGINTELYDAAYVDGCGRWKRLWHVTLPGLFPTIVIMFILRLGSMLSCGYEKVILLYNDLIYETADVISSYVYRAGLLGGRFSYSAAVGLFNSVVNLAFLWAANYISRKLSEESLW